MNNNTVYIIIIKYKYKYIILLSINIKIDIIIIVVIKAAFSIFIDNVVCYYANVCVVSVVNSLI